MTQNSPFSQNYVSQIKPFKGKEKIETTVSQPPRYGHKSIAEPAEKDYHFVKKVRQARI